METAPGETVERKVKWPDDFPDETQRGKTKTVRVQLLEVKRKELPALDDAFARELGEFESLEALRAAVRADMEANAVREADAQVRQQLVDQIVEANPFDVPTSWVDRLSTAYADAYQVPEEERDRFVQEFRPMAETQVRRDLVVDAIAEREKLAASEAEIDDRISEMATERKIDAGQLYSTLQKAGRIPELERSITEEKVFKYLLEQNQAG